MNRLRIVRVLVVLFFTALSFTPIAMARAAVDAAATQTSWIVDEPEVLDRAAVVDAINNMAWPADTHVAVLVSNSDQLRPDSFDADLKSYIASALPSELTSADGLAPNTVLITVAPAARKVSLFGHSTMGVNSGMVNDAVNAMRPSAKAGDWQATVLAGAESASDNLTAPAGSSLTLVGFLKFMGIAVGGFTLVLAVMLFFHVRNERREAEAKAAREAEKLRLKEEDRARSRAAEQKRRERLLAWPGISVEDLNRALVRWRAVADRDPGYTLRGDLSPATNIKRLESVLATNGVLTDEQKLDTRWRAQLEGTLTSFGQANQELDFMLGEGDFDKVWALRSRSVLGSTLRDAEAGLDKVRDYLEDEEVDRAENALAEFEVRTNAVDRDVRSGKVSGPDGLGMLREEVRILETFFRTFAKDARTFAAPSRKRRAATTSYNSADPFNLMGAMWVAAAVSSSSSSSRSSDSYSSPTTFSDFSGGFDGGSGSF